MERKTPKEAKRKYAEVLAEIEGEWAQVRLGNRPADGSGLGHPAAASVDVLTPRLITDREAHLLATAVHDEWLAKFYDNPSEQLHWHTELYEGMWKKYPLPSTDPVAGVEGIADPIPGTMPIENIFWQSMRAGCIGKAEGILAGNGFSDDPWSVHKTARASRCIRF